MSNAVNGEHGSISEALGVQPILDIGGPALELHALHDVSPVSAREEVLWTFLSCPSPFPGQTSLYWDLPGEPAQAGDILRRLLAVPLVARGAFRRLILHVPLGILRTLDTDRSLALRATGVRIASEGNGSAQLERDLARIQPDYLVVDLGSGTALSEPSAGVLSLQQNVRHAWDLGAALLATGVPSFDVLDAVRLLGVRFAEGPLFGPPARGAELSKLPNLVRSLSQQLIADRASGETGEGV